MELQVGDKIRVDTPYGYSHYGIYIGPYGAIQHAIVHNDKRGGVSVVGLTVFAPGLPYRLETRVLGNGWARQAIRNRALALIGAKYDLFHFNCEHAASFAQTGIPRSPQLEALGFLALLVLGVAILSEA